jgi:PAS domain S-box-containing protein
MGWMDSWERALALAGALAALLLLLLGKAVWLSVGKWRDSIMEAVVKPFTSGPRSAAALEEFRAMSVARWQEILNELRPNGGGSLRDAVSRIETQTAVALGRIDIVMSAMGDQVAAYEADGSGLFVWTSRGYCALVGRPPNELLGWGWIVGLHPEDADHVRENWRSSVEDRRVFEHRFRMMRADGEPVPVISRAGPIFVAGRLVGWSGLVSVVAS